MIGWAHRARTQSLLQDSGRERWCEKVDSCRKRESSISGEKSRDKNRESGKVETGRMKWHSSKGTGN
jgi:hypothetical protein